MNSKFPLVNIPFIEAARRLINGGRISFKGMFIIVFYYLQFVFSLPFAFLQFLLYSQKLNKTIILKSPVFILGHYRSGTTLLQKLMVSDKQFGYITNYDALFANTNLLFGRRMQSVFQRLINIFRIKNPFFHNSILQLSEPTEEDDYLMNKASAYTAYWGLVFPKKWRKWLNGSTQFSCKKYSDGWKIEYLRTLKYITFKSKGKQLVLKNPPNTERIYLLLEMFPQAKFIFIYRNPYHLYYSINNMWKRAILAYYSVQKISDEDLEELVFGHFEYLNDRYEEEKKLIPEGSLIEISYEELKDDPFNTMKKIYSKLNLPDFESATPDLLLHLEKEKDYRNFSYQFSDKTLKRIEEKWGKYIRQWNYKA
jgi:omega-hydroxy-beta-dihydromenaquinone-9 sulfotransferase